jgi:tryptophan 2,3-dioxygenase
MSLLLGTGRRRNRSLASVPTISAAIPIGVGVQRTQRDPNYHDLLRLDELLGAALVRDGGSDQMFFLVTHQICEMWFALILDHLDAARAAILADQPESAAERIRRLPAIMRVLTEQFAALATLTPESFERIRAGLGTASGIQSAQWREIEFLCGLRDTRYLGIPGFTGAERERLQARFDGISVAEAYEKCPDERVWTALLEFDEAVVAWRIGHAELAENFLGRRPGTAGSEGAAYLWRMTTRRLFG